MEKKTKELDQICASGGGGWVIPVGFMHQVRQVQLTLLCEQVEVFVTFKEVEKLRRVGHPKHQRPDHELLPLQV